MQVMTQNLRAGVGKYLLELPDPLRETLEGISAHGQVLEDLPGSGVLAWKNLTGPVMSPCLGCIAGVLTSENILLLSEQDGFLNSMKKVTSSVTQLSPLVRLLSPVVTPSDSTDLRTGRTSSCTLKCERSTGVFLHKDKTSFLFFNT